MADVEDTLKILVETNRSGNSQHTDGKDYDPILSDQAVHVIQIIFFTCLCSVLGVFGTVTNSINIIIFCKQGFNDSVNISLVGLAIANLGILITLLWTSICYNPLFRYSNIGIDTLQVEYLTAGWPNGCSASIMSWLTAFITFERCVCIAVPLKVKKIITPQRTLITVVGIYVILIISVIPFFSSVYLGPSFRPEKNKTLIGVMYTTNATALIEISSSMLAIVQLNAVCTVIICTIVLIINLQIKSQWRQKVTLLSETINTFSLPTRDKRIIKMVVFISSTHIACFLPGAINLTLMIHLYPDYSFIGRYHNLYSASWSLVSTCEAINSSVSIFIYYNMSSKFRDTINTHFGLFSDHTKVI